MLEAGYYRHYKGGEYLLIGCAKHSETKEEFVVYQSLNADRQIWIRPKTMFVETVIINGKSIPRFAHIVDHQ